MTLATIKKSKGYAVSCSDEEILESILELAKNESVFAEPAGSILIAGPKTLTNEGKIDKNDVVICVITGHGLKEPTAALEYCMKPPLIQPTSEDLKRIINVLARK